MFQHARNEVHEEMVRVKELEWPAESPYLNHTEHLWDHSECRLHTRPPWPTSVPDLTNAYVAKWAQIPTIILQKNEDESNSKASMCPQNI